MEVPTTDAFDNDDQLEPLTAKLTPKQVGWLQAKAAEQNVSVDHILRSILTAQMQQESQALSESSGDSSADAAAASPPPFRHVPTVRRRHGWPRTVRGVYARRVRSVLDRRRRHAQHRRKPAVRQRTTPEPNRRGG